MILLDEPSMGLSPLVVEQIFEIILRLNREQGITILLVEQNVKLALSVSSYAYILENGELALEGESAALAEDEAVQKAYLGSPKRLRRSPKGRRDGPAEPDPCGLAWGGLRHAARGAWMTGLKWVRGSGETR